MLQAQKFGAEMIIPARVSNLDCAAPDGLLRLATGAGGTWAGLTVLAEVNGRLTPVGVLAGHIGEDLRAVRFDGDRVYAVTFRQTDPLFTIDLTDPTARILRRMLLANAYPVEVDKVGRILVPANLRQFAALEGNAVIAGQGGYFEVWTPAEWEKQTALINDTEANNQRFATLDLSSKN